jgi:hypothetical protein
MITTESTGLRNADELIAYARELGLTVSVNVNTEPARPIGTTGLELPSYTSVSVRITIPCPERFAGSLLGMHIRAECLAAHFHKSDRKGARPKFGGASHSAIGASEDIKILRRTYWRAESMGEDARSYQKLADEKPEGK